MPKDARSRRNQLFLLALIVWASAFLSFLPT